MTKRTWFVLGILIVAGIIVTMPVMNYFSDDSNLCSSYSAPPSCAQDAGSNLLVRGVLVLAFVLIGTSIYMLVSWTRSKHR